jgi:hypothetical protein
VCAPVRRRPAAFFAAFMAAVAVDLVRKRERERERE